ncbi:MAG: FG-GAP-like repeat-containing protein [Planctomycetota bacterium]
MRALALVLALAATSFAQGRSVREILADHARAVGPMHTLKSLRGTGRTTMGRRLFESSTDYDLRAGHAVRRMIRGPVEYVGKAGVFYAENEALFKSRGASETARGLYYQQKILADPLPLRPYVADPGLQRGLRVAFAKGFEVLRGGTDENGYYPLYFLDAKTHLLTRVRWERDPKAPAAIVIFSRHAPVNGISLPGTMLSRASVRREDEAKRATVYQVFERTDQVRRWELNPDLSKVSFVVPGRGVGKADGFRSIEFGTGVRPHELAVADVDVDGQRDVIVAGEHGLSIHFGGAFKKPLFVPLSTGQLRGVLVADMDLDGRPEILTMSRTGPADVLFRVAVSKERTPRFDKLPGGPWFGYDLKGADFDRDGLPDLAATGWAGKRLHVKFGNGVGAFRITGLAPALADGDDTSRRGFGLAIGRLDNDGLLDILVADGKKIRPFMGKLNLAFLPGPAIDAGPRPVDACFADLDNDGRDDLVVANAMPASDVQGDLAVLLNTGKGLKAHAKVEAGRRTLDVAAGDFDGDGNVDVIAPSFSTGHVTLLFGDGKGNLGRRQDLPAGRGVHRVLPADVDGDGKLDIVCANREDDTIMVFFSAAGAAPPPAAPVARACALLDGVDFKLEGLSDTFEFMGEFRVPADIRDPSGIAFLGGDPVQRSFVIVSDKSPALFRAMLDVGGKRLLVGPAIPLTGHRERRLDLEGATFDHVSGNLFLGAEADSTILRANLFGQVVAEAKTGVASTGNDGIEAVAIRRMKDGTPLLYVFREREGKNLLGKPLVHVFGMQENPFALVPRVKPFPLVSPDQTGATVFDDRLYVLCRFRRAIVEFGFDGDKPGGKARSASYAALASKLGHDKHPFPIGEGLAIDAFGDLYLLLDNNGQETGREGFNRGKEGRLLWFANKRAGRKHVADRTVVVRQFLVAWQGAKGNPKVTVTREQAEKIARECLKKLKAGEDIAALATEFGYMAEEWPLRMKIVKPPARRTRDAVFSNELPRAFARLAFALEPGEAGLCEWHREDSPWGFHIIVRDE